MRVRPRPSPACSTAGAQREPQRAQRATRVAVAVVFLTDAIIMQRYAEMDGELERALGGVKVRSRLRGTPRGVEGQ
jgi:hypothetical protein